MWRSVTSALPIAVDGNALPHLIAKIVSRAVYGAAKAATKDSPRIRVKDCRATKRFWSRRHSGRSWPPDEHVQAETAAGD
jgi:hypothetical protein